jgi:hypothetical protein
MVARRALAVAVVLTLASSSLVLWLGKPWSALALTITAGVSMINGFWLEGLLTEILQPGRARLARRAAVLLVARWALWGLLFAFLYVVRSRVEPWAVVAGVACFLVALAGAGLTAAGQRSREE